MRKVPRSESFGRHGQTIPVPIQDLDAVATLVDEDKEMTREGVKCQAARCQGGQAVETSAHVGRLLGEVDRPGASPNMGVPPRQR